MKNAFKKILMFCCLSSGMSPQSSTIYPMNNFWQRPEAEVTALVPEVDAELNDFAGRVRGRELVTGVSLREMLHQLRLPAGPDDDPQNQIHGWMAGRDQALGVLGLHSNFSLLQRFTGQSVGDMAAWDSYFMELASILLFNISDATRVAVKNALLLPARQLEQRLAGLSDNAHALVVLEPATHVLAARVAPEELIDKMINAGSVRKFCEQLPQIAQGYTPTQVTQTLNAMLVLEPFIRHVQSALEDDSGVEAITVYDFNWAPEVLLPKLAGPMASGYHQYAA